VDIVYDQGKNDILFDKRGVSFPEIIEKIYNDEILLDFKHPNNKKYPKQRIMVVNINNYTFCVPYEIKVNKIYLKTIYPDRRFKNLIGNSNE